MSASTHSYFCREYTPSDYATLSSWWSGHGVGAVPEGLLPKCGLMVLLDSEPAACCWAYFDNSTPLAWIAWVTTRPGLSPRAARAALDYMLGAAISAAEAQHRRAIMAEAPTRSLERFYCAHGFKVNHPTVHLFKEIN